MFNVAKLGILPYHSSCLFVHSGGMLQIDFVRGQEAEKYEAVGRYGMK